MIPISRRTVLRGVGATIALPWLEAMTATRAYGAGAAAARPLRTVFLFTPNGMFMPNWTPGTEGPGFALSPTLSPLQDLKNDILVLSGLAHNNARSLGDGPGDHARAAAAYLTGAHPAKTSGSDIRLGVSIDQVLARTLGKETRLPSLELGCESRRGTGECDSGYSCAYVDNISWQSATTPMAKEVDPRAVFDRLFGSDIERKSNENSTRRALYRKSILDFVADDTRQLQARLGKNDQHKLAEYLDAVRTLEKKIDNIDARNVSQQLPMAKPKAFPISYPDHIDVMNDLLALSLQMDITRVATFMYSAAGSNRSFNHIGIADGHHELSHHRDDQEKIEKIKKIDHFHLTKVAGFIRQLKSIKEGDGTLLDHTVVVLGGGLGDGNRHRHEDLPILVAGGAGGNLKTGRHIKYTTETPLSNFFLSLLDYAGAKEERFGDSTGRLSKI